MHTAGSEIFYARIRWPQTGSSAKFYQFIVISLGEVLVSHPIPSAPFNLFTVSLGRLKVILVIRGNPI